MVAHFLGINQSPVQWLIRQASDSSHAFYVSEWHAFVLAGGQVKSQLYQVPYLSLISFKDSTQAHPGRKAAQLSAVALTTIAC